MVRQARKEIENSSRQMKEARSATVVVQKMLYKSLFHDDWSDDDSFTRPPINDCNAKND